MDVVALAELRMPTDMSKSKESRSAYFVFRARTLERGVYKYAPVPASQKDDLSTLAFTKPLSDSRSYRRGLLMSGSTMHAEESGRSVCCTPSLKVPLSF